MTPGNVLLFKMAEDREVLRYIWDGRLPVCFNLSSDEVVTVEQPDPYYVRNCFKAYTFNSAILFAAYSGV